MPVGHCRQDIYRVADRLSDPCPQEETMSKNKHNAGKDTLGPLVRLPLLPILALVELMLLAIGLATAMVHLPTAKRIVRLANRLPDPKWYCPNMKAGGL